ncbi:glycosyltransferase [Moellerella wisconsensis]|uniref:glycosyltransferase n=1 Tax=Moellerella wisconsensis TaxID=158849 RepID=UPI0030760D86
MKILHIIPTLLQGGAEKFTLDLANALSENNKVDLLTLYTTKETETFDTSGCKFTKRKSRFSSKFWFAFEILFLIKKGKYDVVHLHLNSIVFCFISILFFSKVRFVYTCHGDPRKEYKMKKLMLRYLINNNLIRVVAVSQDLMQKLMVLYGRDNIALIENGCCNLNKDGLSSIKNNEKCKSDKRINFLNIARLHPIKNQIELVKAFGKLPNCYHLTIIGKSGNDNYSDELLEKVENYANVDYLGFKSNVSDYLYKSDAILISSLHEGLPISLLEAMSVGKMVLSTPIDSIVDFINENKCGFVTNGYKSNDIALAVSSLSIDILINNRESLIELFKSKYDISVCAKKYILIYESLLCR